MDSSSKSRDDPNRIVVPLIVGTRAVYYSLKYANWSTRFHGWDVQSWWCGECIPFGFNTQEVAANRTSLTITFYSTERSHFKWENRGPLPTFDISFIVFVKSHPCLGIVNISSLKFDTWILKMAFSEANTMWWFMICSFTGGLLSNLITRTCWRLMEKVTLIACQGNKL